MHRSQLLRVLGVFLITITIALVASAADNNPVARISGGGSFVEWQTKITGQQSIQLTIVGPDGEALVREFSGGRNPSVRVSELSAVDGEYTWELRVVPRVNADVKKRLSDARAANDEALVRRIQHAAGIDTQLTQSGGFTIVNGAIVQTDAVEEGGSAGVTTRGVTTDAEVPGRPSFKTTTNDQVIADDLIVQGSACVGLDCVANESFGFDTLRLKENNTRIAFMDTSSSAGFPSNDWQLVANDSASGGQNLFAIFDQVAARNIFVAEAAAPLNALYVDSTGNVGMQTATPVLDFHMVETDTPAVRLEQTSGGGFTAQTWDIGANEANFFVRDVTGGSRLPFRVRPGAPTSSIDIGTTGNVGIGTASPAVKLDIQGTAAITGGSMGIGTTAPASALHVVADAGAASIARFQNTNATGFSGFSFFDQAGTTRMFAGVDNANATARIAAFGTSPLLLVTSNTERARIDTSGNVGIGTTAPASKLHVNGGDIRVSSGSFIDDGTTLNVPDYVFESSYRLMPLTDLAKFVREEKHLPNVPAASSVKSQGLNLSEFQMRLLEKVEELTLYTLDQHTQIGDLKAQNDELRARLAQLEQKLDRQQ